MVVRAIVPPSGSVKGHAFRLEPDDSLKESLCQIAQIIFARLPQKECSSLFMMTAVGSLKDVTLRLANASRSDEESKKSSGNDIKRWSDERFEIVSLVGTFSRDGSCHLHLSISDAKGDTYGGHLMTGIVFTTCEVVIGSIDGVNFERQVDSRTGYKELIPKQIPNDEYWGRIQNFAKIVAAIAIGYSLGKYPKSFQR
jgi:predicted DNA-binding protein with PD1-like motif